MRISALWVLSRTLSGGMAEAALRSIMLQMVIMVVLLLAEGIIYWILQDRLDRISWVWTHIVSLYLVLIALPYLLILGNLFLVRKYDFFDRIKWTENISLIQSILFWIMTVIGHLFFVLTVVRGFSKKKSEEKETNESADILDEFPG